MHLAFQTCGAYYFVKTHFAKWTPISQTPKVLKKLECSVILIMKISTNVVKAMMTLLGVDNSFTVAY